MMRRPLRAAFARTCAVRRRPLLNVVIDERAQTYLADNDNDNDNDSNSDRARALPPSVGCALQGPHRVGTTRLAESVDAAGLEGSLLALIRVAQSWHAFARHLMRSSEDRTRIIRNDFAHLRRGG